MVDPVTAEDGHTYERSAIERWLKEGRETSPLTNLPMGSTLFTNRAVKTLIAEWFKNDGVDEFTQMMVELRTKQSGFNRATEALTVRTAQRSPAYALT